ncbi:MAG: hypothetical protein Q9224_006250, partial [Gallowayella concinna]
LKQPADSTCKFVASLAKREFPYLKAGLTDWEGSNRDAEENIDSTSSTSSSAKSDPITVIFIGANNHRSDNDDDNPDHRDLISGHGMPGAPGTRHYSVHRPVTSSPHHPHVSALAHRERKSTENKTQALGYQVPNQLQQKRSGEVDSDEDSDGNRGGKEGEIDRWLKQCQLAEAGEAATGDDSVEESATEWVTDEREI